MIHFLLLCIVGYVIWSIAMAVPMSDIFIVAILFIFAISAFSKGSAQ